MCVLIELVGAAIDRLTHEANGGQAISVLAVEAQAMTTPFAEELPVAADVVALEP
jgi:hypothetical protein